MPVFRKIWSANREASCKVLNDLQLVLLIQTLYFIIISPQVGGGGVPALRGNFPSRPYPPRVLGYLHNKSAVIFACPALGLESHDTAFRVIKPNVRHIAVYNRPALVGGGEPATENDGNINRSQP